MEALALEIARELGPPSIQTRIFNYLISHPYLLHRMAAALAHGAGAYALNRVYGRFSRRRRVVPRGTTLPVRNAYKIRRIQQGYGQELKTFDITGNAVYDNSGSIISLSSIAQGDSSITREGLQIKPRHLLFRLHVNTHASATATQVRIIIFTDKQQNATAPTVAELLETDSVMFFPEHDTRPRFKIHRDMLFMVDPTTLQQRFKKGMIKFGKSAKIWYKGVAAAATSNGKNALYMYIVSNEATNTPTVQWQYRLRFIDN